MQDVIKFWKGLSTELCITHAIPFIIMVSAIAIFPLTKHRHWWESNKNKFIFALAVSTPVVLYFVFYLHQWKEVLEILFDYLAFIALLASLFVISGGIYIAGRVGGTPLSNCITLLIGSILANFVGTTGAGMLLIRPLIRANRERKHNGHVFIFFIFIVCNIGGCLTPLGDPPLFLGFLRGVPFEWTLLLIPQWAFMIGSTLVVFYLVDCFFYKKEPEKKIKKVEVPFSIHGLHNLRFLLYVLVIVFVCGKIHGLTCHWLNIHPVFCKYHLEKILQAVLLTATACASYLSTKQAIRDLNEFSFYPIREVAALFFGLFMTLVPVKLILYAKGEFLGITAAWQYFWMTGVLSSFLDNAPTYLVFFSLGQGAGLIPQAIQFAPNPFLEAVSCGAVFMGANTYIGNGPNFMVKSIVAHHGIRLPEFIGYIFKYSIPILFPMFVLLSLLFFR